MGLLYLSGINVASFDNSYERRIKAKDGEKESFDAKLFTITGKNISKRLRLKLQW
jgi:hypothetical protein